MRRFLTALLDAPLHQRVYSARLSLGENMAFANRVLTLSLLGAALVSCGRTPAVDAEEVPPTVHPVLDVVSGTLPGPSDFALNAQGVVTYERSAALSDAENELNLLSNGSKGFSLASAPFIRFDADVAAETVTDKTALAFDLGESGAEAPVALAATRVYSGCDRSLRFEPQRPLLPGHTYLFALTKGLRGARGQDVLPSSGFELLKRTEDLRQHPELFSGASEAERAQQAEKAEAARLKVAPLLQLLEQSGVVRDQLLAAWTVTTRVGGEAWFHSGEERIPFPNDLQRDVKTGLVTFTEKADDTDEERALKQGLSKLDGFSTTGALTVELTRPLRADAAVPGRTVRLFRRDTLEEVKTFTVKLSADSRKLSIRTALPLRPGTPYVVLVVGVQDDRGPVSAMPLASILKLKSALIRETGEAALPGLCENGLAARLETQRKAMQPVLDLLDKEVESTATCAADDACKGGFCSNAGVCVTAPRDRIAAAFTFTTQDIFKRLQEARTAPYQANLSLELQDVHASGPSAGDTGLLLSGNCLNLPFTRVKQVITGTMTTLNFLDPVTRAWRKDGQGVPAQIPFVLMLPEAQPNKPMPVVVFGHGLTGERRHAIFMAERLARAGMATIAIDFPYHGERTVCLAATDCEDGATCESGGVCMKDGKKADVARKWLGIAATPSSSGTAFIDLNNLFATRDHFRQAYVDHAALRRLLLLKDWKTVTGGIAFDTQRMGYLGMSLGSIVGATTAGGDPKVDRVLLSVGGAGLVDLMRESGAFGDTFSKFLTEKKIDFGSPAYDTFADNSAWVLGEVDPINTARYALKDLVPSEDPATGMIVTPPAKRLRLQKATLDTVIPGSASDRLLVASGVDPEKNFASFVGSHVMLHNPAEPAFCFAQGDMSDFFTAQ